MPQTIEKINYREVVQKYPWLVEKGEKCILSPDVDGLLCGLFMSHYLDWEVVGFYDGKYLLINEGVGVKECIFLDMDILRGNIRSSGHHMNIHNFSDLPDDYTERMKGCVNPNHLRKFDKLHNFGQKYPLANIHLLLYILGEEFPEKIDIDKNGFGAIFFADGVWKVLFKYTDNVLDWFEYLQVNSSAAWWEELQQFTVIDLIKEMDVLLKKLKEINGKSGLGHIELSEFSSERQVLVKHLELLGELTGWKCKLTSWKIDNFKKYMLTKKIFERKKGEKGGNEKFKELWENAVSLAMTDANTIQYTVDEEGVFN